MLSFGNAINLNTEPQLQTVIVFFSVITLCHVLHKRIALIVAWTCKTKRDVDVEEGGNPFNQEVKMI